MRICLCLVDLLARAISLMGIEVFGKPGCLEGAVQSREPTDIFMTTSLQILLVVRLVIKSPGVTLRLRCVDVAIRLRSGPSASTSPQLRL